MKRFATFTLLAAIATVTAWAVTYQIQRPKDLPGATNIVDSDYLVLDQNAGGVKRIPVSLIRSTFAGTNNWSGNLKGSDVPTMPAPEGTMYLQITETNRQWWINASGTDGSGWELWMGALTNGTPYIGPESEFTKQLKAQTDASGWAKKIFEGQAPINVKWYGALGNGTNDDTTAIQAAVDHAQSNRLAVFMPKGTYLITSSIKLKPAKAMVLRGEGYLSAVVQAAATMTNMIEVGDLTDQATWYDFSDFGLNGNNLAKRGIYSPRVDHSVFYRVRIIGTTQTAFDIGYGWCNDIVECDFSYNSGDGLNLNCDYDAGGNNAVNINKTKVFLNDGWGMKFGGGYNINITGCLAEANKRGGIFSRFGAAALNIVGNYFEGNALVGHSFTNPVVTVKADILINGSTVDEVMYGGFAAEPVMIDGNQSSDNQHDGFLYLIGANQVSVRNNYGLMGTHPLVRVYADNSYAMVTGVRIANNKGFSKNVSIVGEKDAIQARMSTWKDDEVKPKNYLTDDFTRWTYVGTGQAIKGDLTFQGQSTVILSNITNGDAIGAILDVDANPELAGKPIYMGAWVKDAVASTNISAAAWLSTLGYNINYIAQRTNWSWIEFQGTAPTNGTFFAGFSVLGPPSNAIYVSHPILALVGAPAQEFFTEPARTQWHDYQVPTSGTWAPGNIVWNIAPDSGGAAGWVCVEAPCTFSVFGPVADAMGQWWLDGLRTNSLAYQVRNTSTNSEAEAGYALRDRPGFITGLLTAAANTNGPSWNEGGRDLFLRTTQEGARLHLAGGTGSSPDVSIAAGAVYLRSSPVLRNGAFLRSWNSESNLFVSLLGLDGVSVSIAPGGQNADFGGTIWLKNNTWVHGINASAAGGISMIGVDTNDQVSLAPQGGPTVINGALKMSNTNLITADVAVLVPGGATNTLRFINGSLFEVLDH